MAKKRDSHYWLGRLERDHPTIFAAYKAGRIKSVRQACAKAGLIRLPGRLDALKREWKAATISEKSAFLEWTRSHTPRDDRMVGAATLPGVLDTSKALVGADGHLLPIVIDHVRAIMRARNLKPWQVAVALGSHSHDMRVELALQRSWRPTEDFLGRLKDWIATQAEGCTTSGPS